MAEKFEGVRRKFRPEPIEIPEDAPLTPEELFDEDGDIPDDDEVIIGANHGADDNEDEEDEEEEDAIILTI
jgi:hypothetical protein